MRWKEFYEHIWVGLSDQWFACNHLGRGTILTTTLSVSLFLYLSTSISLLPSDLRLDWLHSFGCQVTSFHHHQTTSSCKSSTTTFVRRLTSSDRGRSVSLVLAISAEKIKICCSNHHALSSSFSRWRTGKKFVLKHLIQNLFLYKYS